MTYRPDTYQSPKTCYNNYGGNTKQMWLSDSVKRKTIRKNMEALFVLPCFGLSLTHMLPAFPSGCVSSLSWTCNAHTHFMSNVTFFCIIMSEQLDSHFGMFYRFKLLLDIPISATFCFRFGMKKSNNNSQDQNSLCSTYFIILIKKNCGNYFTDFHRVMLH